MKKRILLVDDNEKARSISRSKLMENGYEVDEAGDGVECMKYLATTIPDLVILDLVMPIMDGYKVLQMIKTNPKTSETPVLVLSGKGQPEEVEKALKLGASDFLVKIRTNPKVLLEKVNTALSNSIGKSSVPRYLIAVKENVYDAQKMAQDFQLPKEYHCATCSNPLVIELIPYFSHDEPWFSGHFICAYCR